VRRIQKKRRIAILSGMLSGAREQVNVKKGRKRAAGTGRRKS
jgi:hypothetical protein